MNHLITLNINGVRRQLQLTSPTQTLLRALNEAGLSGSKEGCGDGDCGACTVACVQTKADGSQQIMAINSCLIPAAALAGGAITTVEGLARDQVLHCVQQALVTHGGSQCGYCTPGFVMSLYCAQQNATLSADSVEGNLCRCTGYASIRLAIESLQDLPTPARAVVELSGERQPLQPAFFRPHTIAEALALKAQFANARWLAGATDLGLEFSHQNFAGNPIIALDDIAQLQSVQRNDAHIEIGAALPLTHIKSALQNVFPLLDQMLHWFAATQVRNRATIGGNLGTASPIGDLLPVLLALDADIVLCSIAGERTVHAADFFLSYRKTLLRDDELIRSVRIARHPAAGLRRLQASYKVGKRGSDDISIVAACFVLDVDADQRIVKARMAYGGVAATPIRAIAAENAAVGLLFTADLARQLKPFLKDAFKPLDDFRGTAHYRQRLVVNLWAKFVSQYATSVAA
jgi:xanthine dehydrogenase small subunit